MNTLMITSRESLEAAIAEVVKLKLEQASLGAACEAEKLAIEKNYAPRISAKGNVLAQREAECQAYCNAHRAELFPEKKSIETRTAVVGFELTPPRVEKPRKLTWDLIVLRMKQFPWARKYVKLGKDTVAKENLLADRGTLTANQQTAIGISFEQDEQFFIRPKSEIVEDTVKVA